MADHSKLVVMAALVMVLLSSVAIVTVSCGLKMTAENYCSSWRMNIELNNIKGFEVVPNECVGHVHSYMTSNQYNADVQMVAEESINYLTHKFILSGDGKDAWIFDVDDTLLSTLPFYEMHQYGGEKVTKDLLEQWMNTSVAPAIEASCKLYNHIKNRGLKIFLVSSRHESLREATVTNLISQGFNGWSGLYLMEDETHGRVKEYGTKSNGETKMCREVSISETWHSVQELKLQARRKVIEIEGYRVWGNVASQWSSLVGYPSGFRTFKLPNPMYYIY